MAFTTIQQGSNSDSGAPFTTVNGTSCTSGSLLVLCFSIFNDTETVTSVTDNRSNTWTLAVASPSAGLNERAYIYYCNSLNATGTLTITVAKSGSAGMRLAWREVAGQRPLPDRDTAV